MVTDSLAHLPLYFSLHPQMEAAAAFLHQFIRNHGELRRYELNENGLYANVEKYFTQNQQGRQLEAHQRYVDLQFVVRGREQIGIKPTAELEPAGEFDCQRDIGFYDGEPVNWVRLEAGDFALLWPHEAHLPCTSLDEACEVIKIVVKLPL